MPAGGSDFQRALGLLLAFDLAEIDVVMIRRAERGGKIAGRRFKRTQALEKLERLAQALDSEHRGPLADHRRLRRVLARQEHAVELARAGQQRGRQRAADSFDPAVEREFAEDQVGAQPSAILEHVLRGENSKRERKIERRALLAGVGRREVNRHLASRKLEPRIFERRLDPVERFLDRALRQPDQPMRRYPRSDVDLDFDRKRVNSDQRAR